ncbi:transport and Golgi organization protein 1 homolog isoform X2 [Tupaia chinensis]|uniref:transport and Golgi organization protein 1 homolog isoform X2 n=1 Tax=Tupaia chinensis TaxID=246437 RepID=UPI0003C8C548|nr:transport and Golgi organization protein 1 homolog isoform X2 [Tupaia chinensis]
MEVQRLLFCVLLLGCPGRPAVNIGCSFGYFPQDFMQVFQEYLKEKFVFLFNLLGVLPDHFHPGPAIFYFLCKFAIITAYVGIVSFAIFLWSTVLAVKPRVYQVILRQISKKIKNFRNENTELEEQISSLEQKINIMKKYVQETERENKFLCDEACKFKNCIETLKRTNEVLKVIIQSKAAKLQHERDQNVKNRHLIAELEKCTQNWKGDTSMNTSGTLETQDTRDGFEDLKLRASRSNTRNPAVSKKNLEGNWDPSRSVIAVEEAELKNAED